MQASGGGRKQPATAVVNDSQTMHIVVLEAFRRPRPGFACVAATPRAVDLDASPREVGILRVERDLGPGRPVLHFAGFLLGWGVGASPLKNPVGHERFHPGLDDGAGSAGTAGAKNRRRLCTGENDTGVRGRKR